MWGRRWHGRHRGHFQIPCGIVVRGGRRQIMRYICHRGASDVRQMDSDILDNGYRPMGGERASGEGGRNGGNKGLGKSRVRLE